MRERIEVHTEHSGPFGVGKFDSYVIDGQEWVVRMDQDVFRQVCEDVRDHASTDGWDGEGDISENDVKRAISRFLSSAVDDGLVWRIYAETIRPTLQAREADK